MHARTGREKRPARGVDMSSVQRDKVVECLLAEDDLPELPHGTPYLLQVLSDDDLDFAKLARHVERFPSIVLRLLSVANSAWSSPRSEIVELEQACARLGLKVVRSIAVAVAVAAPFHYHACPAFRPILYWSSSMLIARAAGLLCEALGRRTSYPVGLAATAGVLSNLGVLLLAAKMPEETDLALQRAGNEGDSLRDTTLASCGIGYDQAAMLLFRSWGLPDPLYGVLGNGLGCELDSSVEGDWSPLRAARDLEQVLRHGEKDCPSRLLEAYPEADRMILVDCFQQLHGEHARTVELAESMGL